jgi:hypothetical protein
MLEQVIAAWHTAVNHRDLKAARQAVTDPVDVLGPRGAGPISAARFADWIIESGIHLQPFSWHPVSHNTMVVEQEATWPDNADADSAATPPTKVATLFRVHDGAVSLVHRFGDLHEALRAARQMSPEN